ncbi:hypothetical protein [Thermoflexibacter ruber]|uniref:hypothetical protein n=1 Tax=Thermoflexibacter ruber TaxID=1003 RepID=UPI0015A6D812|nr:hypothetical protein [Thermoflexibacter ruber]
MRNRTWHHVLVNLLVTSHNSSKIIFCNIALSFGGRATIAAAEENKNCLWKSKLI